MGNSKDSSDDRGEKERTWRDAYDDELLEVVSDTGNPWTDL